MTNKEKFAEKILDIACSGDRLAVSKAALELTTCRKLECRDCLFNTHGNGACGDETDKWANSEYVEPPIDWSKVAVDTPILVRESDRFKWAKKHFAKYENGKVYAWSDGRTSWSNEGYAVPWKLAKLPERSEHGAN